MEYNLAWRIQSRRSIEVRRKVRLGRQLNTQDMLELKQYAD